MRAEGAPAHRRLDALHEHQVARRARGAAPRRSRPSASRSRACSLSLEADARAVGLEVVELLRVDLREAPRVERGGQERDGARGGVAGVVPALEGAHHRRGPEAIRTAVPDEGLHPNHRTSWVRWPPPCSVAADATPRRVATLRAEDEVDGVFACTRKERQISRAGTPVPDARAARQHRHDPRARLPRRRRARRALRARRARACARARRALPRASCRSTCARSRRAEGEEADPTRFLPTAYRDLDELEGFLEHLAREVYDPALKALLAAPARRRALRARDPPRALLGARPRQARRRRRRGRRGSRPITPTSAACSSTPSPSPRWRSSSARCTRGSIATCC